MVLCWIGRFCVLVFCRTNLIIGNGQSICSASLLALLNSAASLFSCSPSLSLCCSCCKLCAGAGMLLIMYSREYYAHQPAHGSTPGLDFEYDTHSWLPYSWQPFVHPNHAQHVANATMRV